MAQCSRTLLFLAEDLGLALGIYVPAHNSLQLQFQGDLDTLFLPLCAPAHSDAPTYIQACAHADTHTCIHTQNRVSTPK